MRLIFLKFRRPSWKIIATRLPKPKPFVPTAQGGRYRCRPAGLAAAAELGKQGYYVCLYEASDKIGGALNMIPDERLPYEVIAKDWSFIFNRDFITLYLTTKIGLSVGLVQTGV